MITRQPDVEGMPLVVKIRGFGEFNYTAHAYQVTFTQRAIPEFLRGPANGPIKAAEDDGWEMSLVGRGSFVISQSEEQKPQSLLVTPYSLEYVQGLEEQVAQLQEQLAELLAWHPLARDEMLTLEEEEDE